MLYKTLLFKCQKCTNVGLPFVIIKYLFLYILCKTLLFKCQKCANVGLPFVIIKYLVLRGLQNFYVLLGPILVLDWFRKRLVQTGPRTMQDQSRLVLSGPVLVRQYSDIFRTRPVPVPLKLG